MDRAIQVLIGLPGVLFLVQGLGWLTDPANAAEGLGMPLLDGIARSTQVGDMTAFFVGMGAMISIGALRRESAWLWSAALLLGGAALFRSLAWALHGAAFATQFIAIEAVISALLVFGALRFSQESQIR